MQSYVKGQLKIKPFTFVWEINDFTELMCETKEVWLRSPIFEVSDGMKKNLWQIYLVLPEEEDSYIKLHLKYLHDNSNFQADNYCFTLSLLDNIGKKHEARVSRVYKFESHKPWGWPHYVKKRYIIARSDSLLVEDTLSVFCEIHLNVYDSHEVFLKTNLENAYKSFYLNEKFSDVTIMIDKEKIHAHRMVLSAKSKVFAAMLEHDMKESNTRTIEINDISLDIMKELLLFMYCGRVNNLEKIAISLLKAADKYDVALLKVKCEKSMKENLNTTNVCETLVISELHNCEKLKTETIDFIIGNLAQITKTNEFMELKNSNPKLLEEILQRISEIALLVSKKAQKLQNSFE